MEVIIPRGIQGSGKSTYARSLKTFPFTQLYICSADDYFMVGDRYEFRLEDLPKAHNYCFSKFLTYVQMFNRKNHLVVVDNTNLRAWEISPYIAVCNAHFVPYKIVNIPCDPEVAFTRNVHNVPLATVLRCHEVFEKEQLPNFWKKETLECQEKSSS